MRQGFEDTQRRFAPLDTRAEIGNRFYTLKKFVVIVGRLIAAGTRMPAYRDIFLEKDEPPVVQLSLEDLLRPETEEEQADALSLADLDDEQ